MTAIVETKTQRRRRAHRRNKKIRRARSMSIVEVSYGSGYNRYTVNGDKIHEVQLYVNGRVECDCGNGLSPCSHVIAVRMYRGEWK